MLKVLYNIYVYNYQNYMIITENYINIHQVSLDISLTQQQVKQQIEDYMTNLYGHEHHYHYKYELIH